jgi:ligand-binding sensor domain-containing protein
MRKTILKVTIITITVFGCVFVGQKLATIWQLRSMQELGWEAERYLWMTGTWRHIRWDVERQIITHRYAKPYNLEHFFVSAENQVWAYGGGIWRFEANKWIEMYENNDQQDVMVYDMGQLADGTIWITTWEGFKSWNPETHQWDTLLVDQPGRTLAQELDGSLWFGLLEDGVMRSESGDLISWNTMNGLVHNQIKDMLVASNGTVWVGTAAGVSRWDGKRWQNWVHLGYPDADGLAVDQFYETTDGVIWVATSQGIAKWENEKWITYERFRSCRRVYSLLETDDGSFWIGCDHGLVRWDQAGWHEYGRAEGISSDSGCRLLLGGNDVLYSSTRNGIYYYIHQQDYWRSILDK